MHEAVKALQQEKLIVSVSGKGTFVLPREESAPAATNESGNLEEQVASLRTELESVKERLSRLEGSAS